MTTIWPTTPPPSIRDGRLRIRYSTSSPIGTDVHPEAVRAVARTVELLASLGHDVEEAAPAIDGAALAKSYLHVYFGQIPAMVRRAQALGARRDDVELMNRILVTLGDSVPASRLSKARATVSARHLLAWDRGGRLVDIDIGTSRVKALTPG